ncbi:hypothetical protein ACGK9U_01160 [Mariniflexile sp. HNIBRBA6329]|uniref:hypothetical protein n=1 Tax=Mariniflexile sp. HNIBRBA6329 TaxID=3373088 RepID=UPI00374598D6
MDCKCCNNYRSFGLYFVLKERSFLDFLRYYTFTLPIIIAIVLLRSIFLTKRKFNLILAAILSIIWLGRSFKIHFPEAIESTDLEVVFWNVSRDNGFEEAFSENNGIPVV